MNGANMRLVARLMTISAMNVMTLVMTTAANAGNVDINDFGDLGLVSPGQHGDIIPPGNQSGFVFEEIQGVLPGDSTIIVDARIPSAIDPPGIDFEMFKPVNTNTFASSNTVYLSNFGHPIYRNGGEPNQYSAIISSSSDNYYEAETNYTSAPVGFYTELFASIPSGDSLSSIEGTLTYLVSFAPAVSAVPEPATWEMMLIGFAGVLIALRRREAGQAA